MRRIEERLYTRKEIATRFGVTVRTVNRWIVRGIVPRPCIAMAKKQYWTIEQINSITLIDDKVGQSGTHG